MLEVKFLIWLSPLTVGKSMPLPVCVYAVLLLLSEIVTVMGGGRIIVNDPVNLSPDVLNDPDYVNRIVMPFPFEPAGY